MTRNVAGMKSLLDWIETCPNWFDITSMQGGCLHVKIDIDNQTAEILNKAFGPKTDNK
tara:strand:- start:589 stop:762 length:174 start_codon:yes stop_codon:yes gene_type:complete